MRRSGVPTGVHSLCSKKKKKKKTEDSTNNWDGRTIEMSQRASVNRSVTNKLIRLVGLYDYFVMMLVRQ